MRLSSMTVLVVFAALFMACGGPDESSSDEVETRPAQLSTTEPTADEVDSAEVTMMLTLKKRSGDSEAGWSLSDDVVVDAEDADLTLSSFDCGARGRWVYLVGHDVSFCDPSISADQHREEGYANCGFERVEVGGSSPSVSLGQEIIALGEGFMTTIRVDDRTPTPFEWYEEPIPSFVVELTKLQQTVRRCSSGIAP